MRRLRVLIVVVLTATLGAGLVACNDDESASVPGATTSTTGDPALGELTVFAAASLTEAFAAAETAIEVRDRDADLTFSFAGSGALATQVQEGAPADVLVTADRPSIQGLADAGLVGTPVVFAQNRLQIIVAPGNPLGIGGLADLADDDVRLVLGADPVPVGRYAREALDRAGVTASPVSLELDVKVLVGRVTSGEADAAVVYATDVSAAGDDAAGVDIAGEHQVVAEYLAAVVATTGNRPGAEAYLDDLLAGETQRALRSAGFLPPDRALEGS